MPFLKISHLFELLAWDSLQGASVAGLKRVDHDTSCKRKKKPKLEISFLHKRVVVLLPRAHESL
jgi:hypothetical protein